MTSRKKSVPGMALLLSMILFLSSVCPLITAVAANGLTADLYGALIIDSAEAFAEFSRNCSSESFSRGKRIVLTQDIDLETVEFSPIPIFAGTFAGNGFTISGFSYDSAGSNLGLFRYVEEGALITNLHVTGSLSPTGSRNTVGGIVGVNRGTISNCSFSGTIMADEVVGGIAGRNEESGDINNCDNWAELTGNRKVGGIVGDNLGVIKDCTNQGNVNTSKEGVIEEEENNEFDFDKNDLKQSLRVEKVNDIGGITGISRGTIEGCRNYGDIGYLHVGYRIGGIAGSQSGVLHQCTNYGTVTGRKDVGGIAGQFEPYLTIFYARDTLDKLGDEFERLSDIGESMSDQIRNTTDKASDNMDEIRDILKDIKNYTRDYKEESKDKRTAFDDVAGKQADKLRDSIDNINADFSSKSAGRAWSRLRNNSKKARELLDQLNPHMDEIPVMDDLEWAEYGTVMDELGSTYRNLLELASCVDEIITDTGILLNDGLEGIEDGVHDLQDQLGEVRQEARTLSDLIGDRKDEIFDHLDVFDEQMTTRLDRFSEQMDQVSDDLKSGKADVRNETDQLKDQMDVIDDVLSDGKDETRDKIDTVLDKDSWFDDISDDESEALEFGTIIACYNQGRITSDYQSGGIVGLIGFELSIDPEKDIEIYGDRSLNMSRYAKATVLNCRNDGEILVEHNYAGGIAGKASVGALIGNQNYGNTTAVSGNYVGGIAGSSLLCRDNYSMNQVSGSDYLGGITGWGCDIKDNYAMTTIISESGEWHGSIAGDMDEDGEISDNYYVDDYLGAIDGISRGGEAVGVPYDNFVQLGFIPEEFTKITVTFLADGQIIETISCLYGQALAKADLPEAPSKDGYYYIWEDVNLSAIKGNLSVHAVYQPWTTAIASSDDKMPVLLAEANFHPEAKLTVWEPMDKDYDVPKRYRIIQAYECSISEQNLDSINEGIIFRVLAKDVGNTGEIGAVVNGMVTQLESRRDGDYLVFNAKEAGTFVILEQSKSPLAVILFAAAGSVLVIVVGVGIYRKKKQLPDQAEITDNTEQS